MANDDRDRELAGRKPFIRVFVPTVDGGGCNGTAYPIGNGLILTARHVVRPRNEEGQDIRDHDKSILVYWSTDPEPDPEKRWRPISDGDVAWDGGPDLDAIALTCRPYPISVRSPGRLFDQPPRADEPWSGSGYSLAGLRDDPLSPVPFAGQCYAMQGTSELFHLDVRAGANPVRKEDWGGASGMPILRGDSDVIIGLVVGGNLAFESGRLTAVPAYRIYRAPGFRAVLGVSDTSLNSTFFRSKLTNLLGLRAPASARALDAIANAMASSAHFGATAGDAEAVAQAFLDRNPPIDAALGVIRAAFDEVQADRELADSKVLRGASDVLRRAAGFVFAGLHDGGMSAAIVAQRAGEDASPCVLSTGLEMVAEIYIAAATQREPAFRTVANPQRFNPGTRNLECHPRPERGIQRRADSQAAAAAEIRDEFLKKIAPERWTTLRTKVRNLLLSDLIYEGDQETASQQGDSAIHEDMARLNDAIAHEGIYMLAGPARGEDRDHAEAGMAAIKQDLDRLMVFVLNDDPGGKTAEMRLFRPYRNMLT